MKILQINHSLIFCNSLLTVEKKKIMSDVQKIGFYSLQTLLCLKNWRRWGNYLRSLKKNSGPRTDPCGTPHVTFCSFALLSLLMQI